MPLRLQYSLEENLYIKKLRLILKFYAVLTILLLHQSS